MNFEVTVDIPDAVVDVVGHAVAEAVVRALLKPSACIARPGFTFHQAGHLAQTEFCFPMPSFAGFGSRFGKCSTSSIRGGLGTQWQRP